VPREPGAIPTAPPERLVVMLYDGARRFVREASAAMRAEDHDRVTDRLHRAAAIFEELLSTLDHDRGGELADRLESIYRFCRRHLDEARLERDPGKLERVCALLGELRDARADVAAS
jgi:flagellar secretion chaperone FliS